MSLLNTDYAVYLPAVNDSFAAEVLKPLQPTRPFPAGLTLSDLIFWDRGNQLWHYSHLLHSVGLHKVGSQPDNAVTRAGRTDCVLLGDSGGYQIGTGKLKGYQSLHAGMSSDEAKTTWTGAYSVRRWIVDWLELHTNYAMTIDMPLWATLPKGEASPFHQCSQQALTDMTVDNLRFIDTHRQGRTRWLNVIQGLDDSSMLAWWQAVKWFDCSGYALAGAAGVKGGIANVLKILLTMRDDGALAEGHNWIHVRVCQRLDGQSCFQPYSEPCENPSIHACKSAMTAPHRFRQVAFEKKSPSYRITPTTLETGQYGLSVLSKVPSWLAAPSRFPIQARSATGSPWAI